MAQPNDLRIAAADMHAIAERLAASATDLHAHAATMGAATIPSAAFGAGASAAAEYEQLRRTLADGLANSAGTVGGHETFVRGVAGGQAATDGSAAGTITGTGR